MKFYVIEFSNGMIKCRNFENTKEAIKYADSFGYDYSISEYENIEDYDNSL